MFALTAWALLGIERIVYGAIYHFPDGFKKLCQDQVKGLLEYDGGLFWMVAKQIGVVIKVFQFGVVGYDVLFRLTFHLDPALLLVGLAMVGLGQLLNMAVFKELGAAGVYFGHQFGYDVPWVEGFPYNLGISDPQYWGVVLTIWGLYLAVAPTWNVLSGHFVVPWVELFWYVMSMKLLEHTENGGRALKR
eukprot:CAMPEP_0179298624 /NCGR_PEP_ID=MMETSP0797-20121207/46087_1 /TAXON_ID=47934 /ORGANISM="Dinophysis acuminata, Strain DAEP01" /LENGTH=189 /DNA_ID=CAMNT_0021008013 /DNA_START=51 /DNA_END=617 /DNA_ORIENTATION=-